jgi:hypothetical protein
LSAYDFNIKYRPRKNKAAADALSIIDEPANEERITISSDSINNILYREVKVEYRVVNQLVVPSELVGHVLRSLHNSMEYPGSENTLSLLWDQFFWPG